MAKRKLFRYWFLTALAAVPFGARAITILPPCNPVPKAGGETCGVKDILLLLENIYNFLLGTIGLFAIAFIIIGGLRMLYWSFMEDSEGELKAAKTTVTRAIVGLVVAICAYVIVNMLIGFLSGGTKSLENILSPG